MNSMKVAAVGAVFLVAIVLPLFLFARDIVPPQRSNSPKKLTPCDVAKQKALGRSFSSEVVTGDVKSATKDNCVGAVYTSGSLHDVKSYTCTGETARIYLSRKGVRVESRGDGKVPETYCSTTICEEGRPCRPAKLTKGIKSKDLSLDDSQPAGSGSKIQELLRSRDEAQEEAKRLQNEKDVFNAGSGIEPWTEEKEQNLVNETKRTNDAQEKLEKLLNAPFAEKAEKDARVAAEREKAILGSDTLNTLAREQIGLCQKLGGCDQFLVEGNARGDAKIAQDIRNEANRLTHDVVKRAYPEAWVIPFKGGEVTVVERSLDLGEKAGAHTFAPFSTSDSERVFYDNTGTRFMEARSDTGGVSLFRGGQAVPIRDEYGSVSRDTVARVLDTPAKFDAFWGEYVGNKFSSEPTSYKLHEDFGDFPGDFPSHVIASLRDGIEKAIPYPDYATLQNIGADVHGTRAAMARIDAWTGGKYSIMDPTTLAEPGTGFSRYTYETSSDLSPLSPSRQASIVDGWEKVITTFPPALYENLDTKPNTIFTFGRTPEGRVVAGGFATTGGGEMWVKASTYGPDEYFYSSGYHELAHSFKPFFPDDWAKQIYGDDWGRAYAGKHGSEALTRDFKNWPVGFARDYGYGGGVDEDQATVFDAMFVNYAAMQAAAQNDLTLDVKMQMIQDSFHQASKGAMDQAWWDRLTPLSPKYTVPRGNLIQQLTKGLARLGRNLQQGSLR